MRFFENLLFGPGPIYREAIRYFCLPIESLLNLYLISIGSLLDLHWISIGSLLDLRIGTELGENFSLEALNQAYFS